MKKKIENFQPLFFDKIKEQEETDRIKAQLRKKQIRKIRVKNSLKAFVELVERFIVALLITLTASIIVTAIFNAVNQDVSIRESFSNIIIKITEAFK